MSDTRTFTEAREEEAAKDDEIQPEDDTPQVSSTRSGRQSATNKNSDFDFY